MQVGIDNFAAAYAADGARTGGSGPQAMRELIEPSCMRLRTILTSISGTSPCRAHPENVFQALNFA